MESKWEWENKLKTLIAEYDNTVDVDTGAVYDLIIRPVSTLLEAVSEKIDYVLKVTDIRRWSEWSDDDVDLWASNFGVVRRTGTKANGVVTFFSLKRPSTKVIIPKGLTVSTVDGIRFRTIERLEVELAEIDNYKNSVTGRYEFPVKVEALEPGLVGNVAKGSIVIIESNIININGVTNKDNFSGGYDRETNEQVINRVLGLLRGGWSNITIEGLRHSIFMNFNVSDVYVEKRNPILFGSIDLYFKGIEQELVTEDYYWYGFEIVLNKCPVKDVLSITSGVTQYQKDIDWKFVKDYDSGWRGSIKARDRIIWISNNKPAVGAVLTVTYVYNKLVENIVDWLDREERKFIDPVIWVREGKAVDVVVDCSITVYKGYDKNDIKLKIKSYLFDYINNLPLGKNLELSDLHDTIRDNIKGIDNIIFNKLCRKGEDKVEDIELKSMEYVSISYEDININ